MKPSRSSPILCPSAQPEMEGARAFGIIDRTGDEPRVAWLEKPAAITGELLALTGAVPPARVFRITAPCQEGACSHSMEPIAAWRRGWFN